MTAKPLEWATFWQGPELELLHARYLTHTFSPHTHEGYVIGVIEGGAETFRYRGARYVAPPRHLVIVNPGEMHTGAAAGDAGWRYRVLYPSGAFMTRVAEAVTGRATLPFFSHAVIHDPALAADLARAHGAVMRWGETEALLKPLADLLTRYADGTFKPRDAGREPAKVARAREVLDAHPFERVPLETLAALVDWSPHHLLRAFRLETGLTPHAYGLQVRVQRAKIELVKGQPIAQVSAQTGFFDQSHFGGSFKRLVGVTPGEYVRAAARAQGS